MRLRIIITVIITALLLGLWHANCYTQSAEIRGLWVTRAQLTSPDKIDRFIETAKTYGFNTLFVQVRGKGMAFYSSKIDPMAVSGFDPLAYTLKRAHEAGLKVHVWINMYYVWSSDKMPEQPNHIVRIHPDWVLSGYDEMFLDPEKKEVQDYLYSVTMEIVEKYDSDGIHYDYIRYPSGMGFGKSEYVTQLVRRLHAGIKALKPNLQISAAVFPDVDNAKDEKGQDWAIWLKEKTVDFVVPMVYSKDISMVKRNLENAVSAGSILAGLGAYLQSEESLIDQIKMCRKLNLGTVLFSYDYLSENGSFEKLKKAYE